VLLRIAPALIAAVLAAAPAAAAADGVVRDGNARFQVISAGLIRLEYAADGRFEDRPTMLAASRSVRAPRFETAVEGARRVIRTSRITLSYARGSGPFAADNLRLTVRGGARATPRWLPRAYAPRGIGPLGYFGADPDPAGPRTRGNLGGWARGLDSQAGPRLLGDGLVSRDGWYFIDDSHSALIVDGGRRYEARPPRRTAYQDGYLFGYGHDYPAALADYRRLSGPPPLLPRKAFGVWFSRYFPYSEGDYRDDLLPAFRRERVPLNVLVVDTDFKAPRIWNGWSWRPSLFPDPRRFLRLAHEQGLDVTLNVHPSIALSDPRFGATNAAAGGLIPALGPAVSGATVEPAAALDLHFTFDWSRRSQLDSYFALHEPFERDGVDFWWLDWCCEEARSGPLIPDGTISGDAWINSQYARRSADRGRRWPSLARIGGSFEDWSGGRPGPWGEHRSSIHFTGDAVSTWEMLDFQTRFNAAEGNAGLPYVSHDIGGFQGGPLTGELYARWIQSGAFGPILRLHSGRTGDVRRLPWEFAGKPRAVAARFLRLRGALGPYLYTLGREAHDTGLPLTRAMYLQWPEHEAAYELDRQYMLGSQLLVAPVGAPGDPATKRVWFPPGRWVDIFTGERHTGPRVETLRVPLERMPVFARAGAIVPLQPEADAIARRPLRTLDLRVFAGRDGRFTLYEDGGEGFAHRRGRLARTTLRWSDRRRRLTVAAARGRFTGRVTRRAYVVEIAGVGRPRAVRVGGHRARFSYDRARRALRFRVGPRTTARTLEIALVRRG
jgi:alpha-glucosidase (family GH31 glycosyl hydrolase)